LFFDAVQNIFIGCGGIISPDLLFNRNINVRLFNFQKAPSVFRGNRSLKEMGDRNQSE
jgi:hypothetical protein